MHDNHKFQKSLRILRKWKGISQKQLGDELDVTDTTVSAWENHSLDRVPPKPMIDMLTKFFDKELNETKINLYEDAGYYITNINESDYRKFDIRLSKIEKELQKLNDLLLINKESNNKTQEVDTNLEELRLLNPAQVSKILGCSRRHVYDLINRGEINKINLNNGLVRIHPREIRSLLNQ
tara:strand:- start:47 stop:586 length:540 start_codon:yes stop_codon:yes gene_type:complete